MDNAKDVARRLEETPYAEDAAVLFETIGRKIKAILIKQKETMGSPGEHIKAYREGITAIATIERELSKLNGRLGQEFSKGELSGESLLAEGSGLDSGEGIGPEESFAGLPPD
jgi:methanogenic corrinoid protein MtbC1